MHTPVAPHETEGSCLVSSDGLDAKSTILRLTLSMLVFVCVCVCFTLILQHDFTLLLGGWMDGWMDGWIDMHAGRQADR